MATEVASIYAKVGADLSGFKAGMAQFNSSINSAGGMFRNFTAGIVQGIGQAFGYAAIGAVRGFGDAIVGAISSAADMQQAIADIAATMSLTADETANVSRLINTLAVDPKLKVGAVEAAQAIDMLGKNAVPLETILGGAARSTILLANSTGGDFAMAADLATDVMAQFKIGADGMTDAVNQIVGVTVNSKLDIDKYRLAVAMAGGVAGAVGIEFSDFNAVLAATASSFASGSDQGTSFKTLVQRLVPDTAPAIDAMKQLGIITADGSNQFFKATGEIKSMSEVAGIMQQAFSGLTEEQKINAATTIFGTDAMRMAFAMVDAGSSSVSAFKQAIGDTSAEEKAAIRTETLAAKWSTFKDIIASYIQQAGAPFLDHLQTVVLQLGDLANIYGPKVIAWAQGASEWFGRVTQAVFGLIQIGAAQGWQSLFVPLEDGTRALDKLFEAFGMTKEEASAASERFIAAAKDIVNLASDTGRLIVQFTSAAVAVGKWIDENIGLENILKAIAMFMAGSFVASLVSTIATIVSVVGSIAGFVASLTGLGGVAATIGGVVSAAIAAIGGPITLIVAAIAGLALAWSQNWFDIQGKTEAAWNMIRHFVGSGVQAIKDFFNIDWGSIGHNMVAGIVDGIKGAWNWLTDTARDMANAAKTSAENTLKIGSPSKVFRAMGRNVTESFAMGIKETSSAPSYAIDRTMTQAIGATPPIASSGMAGDVARRLDVYLHGDSNLPTDRAKMRELARMLQQEFILTGARVAVT